MAFIGEAASMMLEWRLHSQGLWRMLLLELVSVPWWVCVGIALLSPSEGRR